MWINNQTEVYKKDFETFTDFAKFCNAFNVVGIWAYLWKELKEKGRIILTKRD